MYKDKDKQREANKQANKRYRDKQGITQKVSREQGITPGGLTRETAAALAGKEHSMECDPKILAEFQAGKSIKRGKDIKCFSDLPPDVQQTIDRMSLVEGKIDKTIKANRTAIAVNYQRLFPGRYYPVSTYRYPQDAAVTGKPGDADYNGICTPKWRAERGR